MGIVMYSKIIQLKKEGIDQSIKDNSPIGKRLIEKLRALYDLREYSAAINYLFGDSSILVTELTVFQANMLITHAKLLNISVKEKEGSERKNIKPYRNIWNTLEERTR